MNLLGNKYCFIILLFILVLDSFKFTTLKVSKRNPYLSEGDEIMLLKNIVEKIVERLKDYGKPLKNFYIVNKILN